MTIKIRNKIVQVQNNELPETSSIIECEAQVPEIILSIPQINSERELIDYCREVSNQLYPFLKDYYGF